MNRSALLLCLMGTFALINDGRLGPEKAEALRATANKVPSEFRVEFYQGRASLPEDLVRAGHDIERFPETAESYWDRFRSRANVAMSDLSRSVRHYSDQPADKQ